MVKMKKFIVSLMVMMLLVCNSIVVFAGGSGVSAKDGLQNLIDAVSNSTHMSGQEGIDVDWDFSNRTYKRSDGGFYLYDDLVISGEEGCKTPLNEQKLKQLKTGAKKDFLIDYFTAGQAVIDADKNNGYDKGITDEVGTAWMDAVQNIDGVGTQLMTTLMAQTKPDYIAANRIYKPFSGTVGTLLGVISVLIFAALALTMVLDLAYIAIPTFQLFVDGEGEGDSKSKKSFISSEARDAVSMAVGGGGSNSQSGSSNKLAVSIYLKKRVLMLCVLGICMLYLVSGQIFALVGMFIDLFSGFLGF